MTSTGLCQAQLGNGELVRAATMTRGWRRDLGEWLRSGGVDIERERLSWGKERGLLGRDMDLLERERGGYL